jgi:hypothetical protein
MLSPRIFMHFRIQTWFLFTMICLMIQMSFMETRRPRIVLPLGLHSASEAVNICMSLSQQKGIKEPERERLPS